jgi:hypothetical protein
MSGGKGGSSNDASLNFMKRQAELARREEERRQARLDKGKAKIDEIFGDIKPGFYNKYQKNYMGYYRPEMMTQYRKARGGLNFDLARAGTLKSSVAAEQMADLEKQRLQQDASIRSKADAEVGRLRNQVSDAKSASIGQLYATEDPSLAANLASNSVASQLKETPKFDPLGEVFNIAALGAAGFLNANSSRAYGIGSGIGGGVAPGGTSSTRIVG